MKTLVIVIHPNIKESLINKRWIEELEKQPENFEIHQLYEKYPDEKIDVLLEQQLLEKYNKIVFQFPFYWFNCPPFFKKWLDEVLTYGWAYGKSSGYRLAGKKIALAISVGIDEIEYNTNGKYKYSLDQLTSPFEITFNYVHADYHPLFAYYGIEKHTSKEWIEQSVPLYLNFLQQL
ncbi:NAD(P)H oxidoreductase [Sphingobacterium sp. CZ-UAM]|uniref:NAD(P)H-dependent oxidoreductase n=1 Tax=unclassified Sphingobacterium TaxID=2609468 RepID=UPI00098527A2|nr:NAD(P)H-dependent oxidoreductase [Sphingobacterium sp. CZ-UAM]OOG18571.1 NAD(P)H oxidoreductase [Sphingobacterium sp. CZ-UAM]